MEKEKNETRMMEVKYKIGKEGYLKMKKMNPKETFPRWVITLVLHIMIPFGLNLLKVFLE